MSRLIKAFAIVAFVLIATLAPFASINTTDNGSVQLETPIAEAQDKGGQYTDVVQGCQADGWLDVGGDILCGLMALLYYIFVGATTILATIAGLILDFIFGWSITSATYNISFIEKGWTIIRDTVNIVFIFILLFIAIATILRLSSPKPKTLLMYTLLVALVMNFTFFGVRVVIDSGNILARVFYNEIEVVQSNSDTGGGYVESIVNNLKTETENFKPISLALVEKIGPQTLMSNPPANTWAYAVQLSLLIIVLGALNIFLIYIFLSLAMLLLTRVVTLWLGIILAPIAVATVAIPKLKEVSYVGFSSWIKNTVGAAFMAPIFVFMMYLVIMFLEMGFLDVSAGSSAGFFTSMFMAALKILVVGILILMIKTFTEMASGELGKKVGGAIDTVAAGAAVAGGVAATGGTAALAGKSMSNAGTQMAKSGGTKGKIGRGLQRMGHKAQNTQKVNWHQTETGQRIMKEVGMTPPNSMLKQSGSYGDVKKQAKDWYKKRQHKKADERAEIETAEPQKELTKAQNGMKKFTNEFSQDINDLEKAIEDAKENANNQKEMHGRGSPQHQNAQTYLKDAREQWTNFKKGNAYEVQKIDKDNNTIKESTEREAGSSKDSQGMTYEDHESNVKNKEENLHNARKQAYEESAQDTEKSSIASEETTQEAADEMRDKAKQSEEKEKKAQNNSGKNP